MIGRMRYGIFLPLLAVALSLGGDAAERSASHVEATREFAEGEIFLELNDTDDDLGIHASIDGEPWTNLSVEAPTGSQVLDLATNGRLRAQGLTQLFFESAEPTFDELGPGDFFARFPEGRYDLEGRAQTGEAFRSTAVLSHVLAAPPANIMISGQRAAETCDDRPLPTVGPPVVIRWDPATTSHPELGKPGPIRVSRYEVFVEGEDGGLSFDLPPRITQAELPMGVTALGHEFKLEIIAQTTAGNNTATETCFRVR